MVIGSIFVGKQPLAVVLPSGMILLVERPYVVFVAPAQSVEESTLEVGALLAYTFLGNFLACQE